MLRTHNDFAKREKKMVSNCEHLVSKLDYFEEWQVQFKAIFLNSAFHEKHIIWINFAN